MESEYFGTMEESPGYYRIMPKQKFYDEVFHVPPKELKQLTLGKWKYIVSEIKRLKPKTFFDGGRFTCAYCYRYNLNCEGCPIKKHTGRPSCKGTPYYKYWDRTEGVNWEKKLEVAEEMLRFLERVT